MSKQNDKTSEVLVPPIPESYTQVETAPSPVISPAEFPRGFWQSVDYLLHHPEQVMESVRQDVGLWPAARLFFVISLSMSLLYGCVMGATNLLQGSAMALGHKFLMILCGALKVPILYLVTFAIVLPPIYVSNAFVGARLTFRQMVAAILGALALTVTVLVSMATVAAFFALTSLSYNFVKLLHVVIFAYAGTAGLGYLVRCMQVMHAGGMKRTPRGLFVLWLVLYMFVGTQMAWVLRPFVGSPGEKFEVFRPRQGNFYESVLSSLDSLMNDETRSRRR